MTIDRVVLHDATYTTLLQAHLEARRESDALLLGSIRKHHRNVHDDSADNVATCTTEASILAALCMPGNLRTDAGNRASVDKILLALQQAPSECCPNDAIVLGWSPLRRKTGPGKLTAADKTFAKSLLEALPSIYSNLNKDSMGNPAEVGEMQSLICLELGLQTQGSDSTPTLQVDLVANEIQAGSSAPNSSQAWQNSVTAGRVPVSVSCLRSFAVQEHYQSFRPHVASSLPFMDPSHLANLQSESKKQAESMKTLSCASCDAVRHKAVTVWNQELKLAELEAYVRGFEGCIAAAQSTSATLTSDQRPTTLSAEQ